MLQIALIPHQHNNNIIIGILGQLRQPRPYILKRRFLDNIINQQCAHGAPIICRSDGAVAFLAGRVPDLGFDCLSVDLDGAGRELDADGGLAVEVEFIAGEAGE